MGINQLLEINHCSMMEIPSFVEGEMFQCLAHLDEDMLDTP